jgi:hypothetical protein
MVAIGLLAAVRSAAVAAPGGDGELSLTVLSSRQLSGVAGDFVSVDGAITNWTSRPLSDVTTYLSLVDDEAKAPVDLEDWSAEKGRFVGVIESGQTLPLDWKIHFVKAGRYSLVLVATHPASETPRTSALVHFIVLPKRSLLARR